MRLLAISDTYIPAAFMADGLAPLRDAGIDVHVRHWDHPSLIALQEDNLRIETGGADAVLLPVEITRDADTFDIIVAQFAPVGGALIRAAANLKLIGVLRGGSENIDVALATQRGVCVMNTPGRNARAVAECAMGMILSEIRNIARAHADMRSGKWHRCFPNSAAIPELCGKTIGLVGFGAVGRLMAGYLAAFGSRVVAYDPYFAGDGGDVEMVSLDQLLRQSDVVSIHARLTKDSRHMIAAGELALMKPTAVLVNTARSGLVDEQALADALRQRRIMGAAIDVFDEEPLSADHPFMHLDNVTITPHLAGSTIDSFRNSPRMMAEHVRSLLAGRPDVPIINGIRPHFSND